MGCSCKPQWSRNVGMGNMRLVRLRLVRLGPQVICV